MDSRRLTELGNGLYSYELRGAMVVNAGIVIGTEAAAVIDTGTIEADAQEILEVTLSLTDRPLRYVINTHHHGDHTFGNWWLLPAIVVGHERCRLRLVGEAGTRHRDMFSQLVPVLRESIEAVTVEPPAVTFEESLQLHLGDRSLRLDFLGRAHTDNDIAIRAGDELVFAGDLIEEAGPPVAFEAFTADWGPTLRRLAAVDAATYVPGHGRAVDRAFVERQAAAFEAVSACCSAASSEAEATANAPAAARAVLGGQLEPAVRRYFANAEAAV
jgi:glyoxylase-like metal-dependent hydrolase (beta-lactamase superfamily II)